MTWSIHAPAPFPPGAVSNLTQRQSVTHKLTTLILELKKCYRLSLFFFLFTSNTSYKRLPSSISNIQPIHSTTSTAIATIKSIKTHNSQKPKTKLKLKPENHH